MRADTKEEEEADEEEEGKRTRRALPFFADNGTYPPGIDLIS